MITEPNYRALHPITLAFRDRANESAFILDHAVRSLSIVRVSLLFAALLYVAYSLMDHWLVPDLAPKLLVLRVCGTAFLAAVAAFSVLPAARLHFQLTMSLVIVIAGSGVIAIVVMVEHAGWYNYYGGVILATIYAHALLRLRFIWASLTSWTVIGLYLVAVMAIFPLPPQVIANNVFHLVSANLLGMFASYGLEYYARTVFLKTRMLIHSQHRLSVEYERTMKELSAVREIQLAMLPDGPPGHPSIDLAVEMTTATEVGGDYYDFVVCEDGSLTFAIGDATGHGARAGALVTAAKLLFSTYAVRDEPTRFLERTSNALQRMRFPKLFMTMAIGKICGSSMVIAGAGMPPALLVRAGSSTIERVPLKGIPLGAGFNGGYSAQTIPLAVGDVILLMSDGLPELFNSQNIMLGYETLEQVLQSASSGRAGDILASLLGCAEQWRNGEPLRDDTTLLVMKINAG